MPIAEKDAGVVTWAMPREDALDLLRWLRHNRPLGMPDRTFDGLLDALTPASEPAAPMPDAEKDPTMTLAEVEALVEDDVMTWLENPFMSPEMLAGKVCWWVTAAVHAARDTSVTSPAGGRVS